MATILRNDDAEALILDIRVGRAAAAQVIGGRSGAFLAFPTSVVLRCPAGGQAVFPLSVDVEPGSLVDREGRATVSAAVDGVGVEGNFAWRLVDGGPALAVEVARYRFNRRGRTVALPHWADQLPSSRCLLQQPPARLARQQARLIRAGRTAEHWLMTLTEQIVRHACRGPIRLAIARRPQLVDVDDVVQRCLQTASRLLPLYASDQRPPCSWLGMINLDGKRDMYREVSRLDWVPRAAAVRTRSGSPVLTSLESLPAAVIEAATAGIAAEVSTVGEQPGHAAAAVARLVGGDAETVALAAVGDPTVLRSVSRQVVGALSGPAETQAVTRGRCWTEFARSGRLFATDEGVERFASLAAPDVLAAIDDLLAEAAGFSRAW